MARPTKEKVAGYREKQREAGLARREFWVPQGLTRGEARTLQEWIPDIVSDIRGHSAPDPKQEEIENDR